MHFSELAALDGKMRSDAEQFFRNIVGATGDGERISSEIAPLVTSDRFVELRSEDEALLFRSHEMNGRAVRTAEFRQRGLILRIGTDLAAVNQIGRDIGLGMLAAIPTVLIVITIGCRWIARQALAPVEAIPQAASRISVHNLDQRLPMPASADEIAALVEVLNATFERLQRSLEQSVRFSSEASHHLKTPLSVLRAGVEEILTDPGMPLKQQECANGLLHKVHQLTSIAENLLLLARADAGRLEIHREEFDLCEVLDSEIGRAHV